jgi:hypothetical protein
MINRSGSASMRITVSEVCTVTSSIPGISGSIGRDPAASTNRSAVIVSVPPSCREMDRVFSASNVPNPSYTVMLGHSSPIR